MILTIGDHFVTKRVFEEAAYNYMLQNGDYPKYALINPKTKRRLIEFIREVLKTHIVYSRVSPEGITECDKWFDVHIIYSSEIRENTIIFCR